MIRRGKNGKYFCDGHECGYPLQWFNCDLEEDGAEGMWVCLDCNDSLYADWPKPEPARASSPYGGL